MPNIDTNLSPEHLSQYFHLGYIPDAPIAPIAESAIHKMTLEEAIETCEELLQESLRQHLLAQPHAALMLSGGIDSGVLAAICKKYHVELGVDKAVTIRFDIPQYDESPLTRQTAEATGMELTTITLTSRDVFDAMPKLMSIAPLPFADSSLPAFYHACASGVSHTYITGDGADELFGGYRRYRAMMLREKIMPHTIEPLLRLFFKGLSALLPAISDSRGRYATYKRMLSYMALPAEEAYLAFQAISTHDDRRALLPDCPESDYMEILQNIRKTSHTIPWYNRFDLQYYLPFDGQVKESIASKCAGVKLITPLLDDSVQKFALSLPASLRFNHRENKIILRALAQKYLPPAITETTKRGFGIPMAQWFRKDWSSDIQHIINTLPDWDTTALITPETARQLCTSHLEGSCNNAPILWAIYCLYCWLQSHP